MVINVTLNVILTYQTFQGNTWKIKWALLMLAGKFYNFWVNRSSSLCTFAKFIRTDLLIDYLNKILQNTEFLQYLWNKRISQTHVTTLLLQGLFRPYVDIERKSCAPNRPKTKNSALDSLPTRQILSCSKIIVYNAHLWYITCILFIAPRESYHVCTAQGNWRVTAIRKTMQNEMVVNIFRRMIPLFSA